jgi:hypothetical protein
MKPVSVAALNSREEAEPLRARLQAAGIPAEIRDELSLGDQTFFTRPSAGVRVEVARDDFETALQLIYDWNAAEAGAAQGPMEWLGPNAAATGFSARRQDGEPGQ